MFKTKILTEELAEGEQTLRCCFADLHLKRTGNIVEMYWHISGAWPERNPDHYVVSATMHSIGFIPDPNPQPHSIFNGRGHGTLHKKLEEGEEYYFDFTFLEEP